MYPLAARQLTFAVALFAPLALLPVAARGQMPPDKQAELLLSAARRACNEKDYSFAATKFREFLQHFGNHKEAAAAHYGLALALIEGPEHDYSAALPELNAADRDKSRPEYPKILYYRGVCRRGLGLRELGPAAAKPGEARHRLDAIKQFEEAAVDFANALAAFTATAKAPASGDKRLSAEQEWVARARCDLAEIRCRTGKAKEARETITPLVEDKSWQPSRYHGEGLYLHGYACFLLGDDAAAVRSLDQPAVRAEPVYDSHALYLLARVRHRGGRLAEARKSYEKVLAEYAKQRKQPEAKGTDPEHVARAAFFLGAIDEEEGRYAEALAAFEAFAKQYPGSSLLPDAALRRGLCLVEMKRYAEAQKILKLLADGEPRLADQALAGLARAQVGAADPAKAAEYDATLKAAADAFRQAAEKAHQAERTVPAAKTRRGEILLQLAGVQQLAKQFKEAAATYQSIESEKLLPSGDEETAPGLAAAFQLAGDYQNADQVCTRFQQAHPKSPLLAEVLFRYAESAALQLQAAQKLTDSAAREREVTRLADETGRRYADILSKFPKHPSAHLARCGLGLAHYHKGDLAKARSNLAAIPAADRTGELAVVPYYLADIQIRTLPKPADELAGALRTAADQLEGFIAAQPDGPLTPDALVKLGYCRQRLAGLAAKPDERAKALADARAAYEQVTQRFPKHELMPRAFLERARTLADAGDVGSALTELRRFTADPLKAAPVAPMGLLHLATLLRGQGKAAEAEQVLDQCRKDHENALKADPARSAWLPVLQYQHGLALREVGKSNEARAVFEGVFNQWPDRSEACESALRSGQCLADSGRKKLADAAAKLAAPDLKPEAQAAGRQLQADGVKDLQEAENYLTTRAEQLKAKHASSEARCRMLYEAAWVTRALSAVEVEAARAKARQELWQKKKEEVAKQTPAGADPPPVPIPVLPANAVPLQPAEVRTRGHYHTLIGNFPDSATATDSRFELAELLSERGEHDAAVKLLNEALAKRPALADKVNVRLGECLFAKGDFRGALAKFEPVAADPKSEAAPAAYRAGECLMRLGDHAGAVKHFAAFRDRPAFQKISGLTDRALLRLGHALGRLGQWDASRQALELVVANFGDGLWAGEARYGIGWALQNKGDYDGAVAAYARVAVSLSETGARARLNTGLCRLAQKRYAEAAAALLVVPYTYDYPQLNALALLEAARALAENKQGEEAARLLKRLLRDYPATAEAEAARKRLEELTKG